MTLLHGQFIGEIKKDCEVEHGQMICLRRPIISTSTTEELCLSFFDDVPEEYVKRKKQQISSK